MARGAGGCDTGGVRLVQVAQRATDLDRAAAFYAELLQTPPVARFEEAGLVFFDLDGVRLLLDRGATSALVYLQVDNVHEALERVGAEVVSRPHVIFHHADDRLGPVGQDEWQAFIKDSEENLVGLVAFQKP